MSANYLFVAWKINFRAAHGDNKIAGKVGSIGFLSEAETEAELEAEAASLGSVAARSLRQARQLESCQIVEKFCFLSCFMLLSGLVHIHTDRQAARVGKR